MTLDEILLLHYKDAPQENCREVNRCSTNTLSTWREELLIESA